MAPIDVNYNNQFEVWDRLYKKDMDVKAEFKFEIGDLVRIPVKQNVFKKGYEPNFTAEIYSVTGRIPRVPPVYIVANEDGVKERRKFYEYELVRVKKYKRHV